MRMNIEGESKNRLLLEYRVFRNKKWGLGNGETPGQLTYLQSQGLKSFTHIGESVNVSLPVTRRGQKCVVGGGTCDLGLGRIGPWEG